MGDIGLIIGCLVVVILDITAVKLLFSKKNEKEYKRTGKEKIGQKEALRGSVGKFLKSIQTKKQ